MSKEIRKRIPIQNKSFNKRTLDDRVYAWFQENSFVKNIDGENITISPYYIVNVNKPWLKFYPELSEDKAKRKFTDQLKKWIKLGFIGEYEIKDDDSFEHKYYILPYDKQELYYLIDTRVLEYLVNTKSSGAIKIYTYLMFKYSRFENHTFTLKTIGQDCFGVKDVSKDKTGLAGIINDCLIDLESNGFFSINHNHHISINGKASRVKQLFNINTKPYVIFKREELKKLDQQEQKQERNLEEEYRNLTPEEQQKLIYG